MPGNIQLNPDEKIGESLFALSEILCPYCETRYDLFASLSVFRIERSGFFHMPRIHSFHTATASLRYMPAMYTA